MALQLDTTTKTVAECLKEVDSWGSTTYQNVCDGTSATVPWGALNYAQNAFVCTFIFGLGIIVVGLVLLGLMFIGYGAYDRIKRSSRGG